MGQQQAKQPSILDKNWQTYLVPRQGIFSNTNPYASRTFRNRQTNEFIQQYQLQFSSEQDYLSYIQQLQQRIQPNNNHRYNQNSISTSPFIYKILKFQNRSVDDMCSSICKGVVYIQKVQLRLKQINDYPFADYLYLIYACLEGFRVLYQKIGFFNIVEQMVFINSYGFVKVWLNPNLSKNQPYFTPSFTNQQIHGSQSQMIVNLINFIQGNADHEESNYIYFKQYLKQKSLFDRLSFYKAIQEFKLYILQNKLIIPSYMQTVRQLYHKDEQNLGQSIIQKSQVIRVTSNRGIQESGEIFNDSRARSKLQKRHSPIKHSFARNFEDSHASRPSLGTIVQNRRNQYKFQNSKVQQYEAFPFIPPLPINLEEVPQISEQHSLQKIQKSFPQMHELPNENQVSFNNQEKYRLSFGKQDVTKYQNKPKRQNISIKFSYSNANTNSSPLPITQNTISNINYNSYIQRQKTHNSIARYYSPDSDHLLDAEIAEDLNRLIRSQQQTNKTNIHVH